MKTLTLRNDFHNSEVRLSVQEHDGVIALSEPQIRRAKYVLCGIKDCTCSGELGIRGQDHTLKGEPVNIEVEILTEPRITGAKLFINP